MEEATKILEKAYNESPFDHSKLDEKQRAFESLAGCYQCDKESSLISHGGFSKP
ncbi:MAG: hypothetical protein N2V75_05120 [Methanophagales archaeon]|nr:hypothetical protein [Methanophagales archaeon]